MHTDHSVHSGTTPAPINTAELRNRTPNIEQKCEVLKQLRVIIVLAQSRGAFRLEESVSLYNSIKRIDEYVKLHSVA
jgi:hypothetical protein